MFTPEKGLWICQSTWTHPLSPSHRISPFGNTQGSYQSGSWVTAIDITVSKSYQALVDEGLVEKRRGLGMFVMEGARRKLVDTERNKFVGEEWPAMLNRIQQLGLDIEELPRSVENKTEDDS